MTLCEEIMVPVREALAWTCEALPDGRTLLVTTDRIFADGDVVSVMIRRAADGRVVVSDGGLVSGRLGLNNVPWDRESVRTGQLWLEIRRAYGVEESNGKIYIREDSDRLPSMLQRLADAAVALDTLVHVNAVAEERQPFSDKVVNWLRTEVFSGLRVEERAAVADSAGEDIHRFIQATVPTTGRKVIIRAIGGSSQQAARRAAVEAVFSFSRVSGEQWPTTQRLAVVSDLGDLRTAHIEALQEHAYVGDWDHQVRLREFILGKVPRTRYLAGSFA